MHSAASFLPTLSSAPPLPRSDVSSTLRISSTSMPTFCVPVFRWYFFPGTRGFFPSQKRFAVIRDAVSGSGSPAARQRKVTA